ncbi:hypothetical protein Aglo01_12400 [Actinokineospora globicatena]|nr:hypothetical protein Aglo01_12400 [Actinokineospora globicatena]GLW83591.1 hypothetical protein Aglo02_12310 [Actinokineospora globicatena]
MTGEFAPASEIAAVQRDTGNVSRLPPSSPTDFPPIANADFPQRPYYPVDLPNPARKRPRSMITDRAHTRWPPRVFHTTPLMGNTYLWPASHINFRQPAQPHYHTQPHTTPDEARTRTPGAKDQGDQSRSEPHTCVASYTHRPTPDATAEGPVESPENVCQVPTPLRARPSHYAPPAPWGSGGSPPRYDDGRPRSRTPRTWIGRRPWPGAGSNRRPTAFQAVARTN